MNTPWCWRVTCPEGGHGSSTPLPIPCPIHLFRLAVPKLSSFTINQSSSKWTVSLSSVSHYSKLSKPRRCRNPWFMKGQKYQRPALVIGLWSEGAVLVDWALNVWDLMVTPGRQCENWIELSDTQLVLENWSVWKTAPVFSVRRVCE